MASLWKHPKSKYWVACFTGPDGRQMKRSTRILATETNQRKAQENRREADKQAVLFEEAGRNKRSSEQFRRVFSDIHQELFSAPISQTTMRKFATDWLAIKKNETKATTLTFYSSTTDRFIKWLGDRADAPLDEISAADVKNYINDRRSKVSAVTANHELKSLRTMFKAAKIDTQVAENPTENITSAKERRQKDRRPFGKEEIEKLLKVADDEWGSMITCALYTGQRLGDIAGLTWDAFDLKKSEYRLVTRKTGKALHLPLPPPLKNHLAALNSKRGIGEPLHPRAFTSLKEKGRTGDLSRQFGDLLSRAGLRVKTPHRKKTDGTGRDGRHERQALSFHSFRNTATTWLHEAGIPAAVVQAMIGHDSTAVHAIYVNVGRDALQKAANAFPTLS